MVKSSLTEWYLVTKLFTMDANQMFQMNTEQVKVCYSDKFGIQLFTIQIPTVDVCFSDPH